VSLFLYMDENVPIAITEGLRIRGVDVLTVQEDGLTSFPDPVVFDRAEASYYDAITRNIRLIRYDSH
jgi:hypothetical protein